MITYSKLKRLYTRWTYEGANIEGAQDEGANIALRLTIIVIIKII